MISKNVPLKAVYHAPATNWETESMPLGNGFLGASVFGGADEDRIVVNENTLWSGGPGSSADYNGELNEATPEENKAALKSAREALQRAMTEFTKTKSATIDDQGKVTAYDYPDDEQFRAVEFSVETEKRDRFGAYQQLGTIHIVDENRYSHVQDPKDYERVLDLDEAVATVSYRLGDARYQNEYFVSYPDNFMAIRLTADQEGAINKVIYVDTPQPQAQASSDASTRTITMTGSSSDQLEEIDHLKFAQRLLVRNEGGSVEAVGNGLRVKDAASVTIYMTAGTNYQQCMDDSFDYFTDEDPLDAARERLETVSAKNYEDLKAAHIRDYQNLFHRVKLKFGDTAFPEKTTDQLLSGYRTKNTVAEDRYLETLYYQFGRYLLISSSREGSLPANLQGIWAEGLAPAWNCDYHGNINVQMNYWLAEETNLAECHLPLVNYLKSLVAHGNVAANHYCYNVNDESQPVRGWDSFGASNIWGRSIWSWGSAWAAGAWMCEDIWEIYQYNLDKTFLEENFDTMKGAALFWVDNLVEDTRDGTLVVSPSWSDEHGVFSLGCAYDQEVVMELFQNVLKAAEVLGKSDESEIQEIKDSLERLSFPLQIGLAGEFMEWKDELNLDLTGDHAHRHISHLYALYPGTLVVPGRSEEDDRYAEAIKKALEIRTDEAKYLGKGGWSAAWKVNQWARLRDGEHAYKLVNDCLLLNEGVYQNLFSICPPFQIDANFGFTAGVTEMLLQSQAGSIAFLPALPAAWADGNVDGLKARGNFEVSMDWKDGALERAEITSGSGGTFTGSCPYIGGCEVRDANGEIVAVTRESDDRISFETTKGATYDITMHPALD